MNMLKIATGASEESDTVEAVNEALQVALDGMDGVAPKAALAFVGIDVDAQALVDAFSKALPGVELAGCTTDGEVAGPGGFLEDSVVITLFGAETIDFTVGIGHGASADPKKATADAVADAKSKTDKEPALCVAMPEGIGPNISDIVGGLRDALGQDFPVVGGASGDQMRFQGTRQLCNTEVASDSVVVLIMSGPLIYSCGVATGYVPLGNRHKVTKAEGSTIHEIDGNPAINLYRDYVEGQSVHFPLAVYSSERADFLLSSPQAFHEDTGAVTFVNPIEVNKEVQLATASRDEIIAASRTAVENAFQGFPKQNPDAALFFSCAGRRAALGTRTKEEYESFEAIVGGAFPTAGFYTYGEIGPAGSQGKAEQHTNAFLAVLLGAAPAV
jgi:hypothetical protein